MEKKNFAVEIIEAVVNPLDPSTAGAKVRIDLSRPNQIAKDFHRALRDHPNIRLTHRKHDPALYRAVTLGIEKGWSLRQSSRNWVGNTIAAVKTNVTSPAGCTVQVQSVDCIGGPAAITGS